ncbi:TPA: hypothetical protein L6B33_14545 [Pseudomonas aeruginosa]|nr:hypothetical protein U769_01300 [Pseudomonas aeruginosa MTB-1]ETD53731.1 hypothetical protein X922_05440 [Pseudomonas aeruginosa VRFPA08]PBV49340.1 hypothetical protein CJU28_23705 [Pseudomonas aeruginosa]QBL33320.1 hypothetical protein C9I68_01345 [Pseudomonas aeruginosa]RPZ54719.1 hypothetical protein IPC549_32090 [Pseudomonas aeruginosa]
MDLFFYNGFMRPCGPFELFTETVNAIIGGLVGRIRKDARSGKSNAFPSLGEWIPNSRIKPG